MIYRIKIDKYAAKVLADLPKKARRQIGRRIEALATDPFPAGCQQIGGAEDIYRLRSSDYCIGYKADKKGRQILILLIGHRKDFYGSV